MKAWRSTVEAHVAYWSSKLHRSIAWWPRFLYHFTDVQNAVRVLESGAVLSRTAALDARKMAVDNASSSVISGTQPRFRNCARLYFRPRTPTQYNNEGIRPRNGRSFGAHCAIPVFFLFDTAGVILLDGVEFSDGNVASRSAKVADTEEFFKTIPFADIFTSGGMGARNRELTFHRNAEVLVPEKLPLEGHLKLMFCRTPAERQTFLHLMSPELRMRWESYVRVATDPLFECRGTFVVSVTAIENKITFAMNPSSRFPGPFDLQFRFSSVAPPRNWLVEDTVRFDIPEWSVRLKAGDGLSGVARLTLDEALAFEGPVALTDQPF